MTKTLKLLFITSIVAQFFSDERSISLNDNRNIDENVLSGSDFRNSETFLFGISFFNEAKDTSILNTIID